MRPLADEIRPQTLDEVAGHLTGIFINNHIIDSYLGSRSGSSRQCKGRYSFVFGIS